MLKNICPPINLNATYTGEDAQWEKGKKLIVLENILTLGFWIVFDIWILSFELYSIGHHKSLFNTHSRVGIN
jgi:hypothetical protein